MARRAIGRVAGTAVLAVGATVGRAYQPPPGELVGPMFEAYNAGDFDGAEQYLRVVVADHPEHALAIFNLACCESRLGKTEDALAHVLLAVELDERLRAYARDDDDLAALRGDRRFDELIASVS